MKNKSLIYLSVIIGAFLIIAFLSVVFGGFYNVGATDEHSKSVEWIFRKTMESSVRNHGKSIKVPVNMNLNDRALSRKFYGAYTKACQTCHGAPGKKADPWMFIYPSAPDLTDKEVVARWSDAELFWIIKNGIKDTGMPALGPTHQDEEMWGVTALVRQLPNISIEEYQAMGKWFIENGEKEEE